MPRACGAVLLALAAAMILVSELRPIVVAVLVGAAGGRPPANPSVSPR